MGVWAWGKPSIREARSPARQPSMKLRVITAVILIPPVIYLIGWSPKWLFLLAILAVVEISLHEYFSLFRAAGFRVLPILGYLGGGLICLTQTTGHPTHWAVAVAVLLLLFVMVAGLWRIRELKEYLGAVAATFFGICYVALTLSLLYVIRYAVPEDGRRFVLLLFLVIWADDIFAYLIGRSLGKHLIFPRVSPKKTVEGSAAGLLGSLLVAWAFAHWFWQTSDLKSVMLLSLIVAVAGQVGDLAESALKRGANIKDSGTLLPGHGGMLDRIDSLLFGVPAIWLYLYFRGILP